MSQAEKEPETSELILKSKSHASSLLPNYHFNIDFSFFVLLVAKDPCMAEL